MGTRIDEQVAVALPSDIAALRCGPLVSMMQAANFRQLNDPAEFGSLLRPWVWSMARQ